MAKQIFMAIVRGIFWAILGSLYIAFVHLVSIYLNPENRAGLVQGLILGTGLSFMILIGVSGLEERFFKKFWHGKYWLPFYVSMLVTLLWAVLTWSFLKEIPYYQPKHGGSPLLSTVGMMGAMILLFIVQLYISRWLRLRAEKKKIVDAIVGHAVKRTETQEK